MGDFRSVVHKFLVDYFPKYMIGREWKIQFGKKMDWNNPVTLNEKIQWLLVNRYDENVSPFASVPVIPPLRITYVEISLLPHNAEALPLRSFLRLNWVVSVMRSISLRTLLNSSCKT